MSAEVSRLAGDRMDARGDADACNGVDIGIARPKTGIDRHAFAQPLRIDAPLSISGVIRKTARVNLQCLVRREHGPDVEPAVIGRRLFDLTLLAGNGMLSDEIGTVETIVVVVNGDQQFGAGIEGHEKPDVAPVVAVVRNASPHRRKLRQERLLLVERRAGNPKAAFPRGGTGLGDGRRSLAIDDDEQIDRITASVPIEIRKVAFEETRLEDRRADDGRMLLAHHRVPLILRVDRTMTQRKTPSILFVTYSHNLRGGIEIWQQRMLGAFRAAGWQTTLGLARGSRFNDPEAYRKAIGEASVETFDGRTGTHEGRILAVQNVVARLQPDVVVASVLGHALPAVGRLKAAGANLRLVYPIHATNPHMLGEALSWTNVIDLVAGVNPLYARFFERRGVGKQTATIPYGTDVPEQVRYGRKDPGRLTLLFAGRFHLETKRVLDAVALARELDARGVPFRFLMAGSGPDENEVVSAIRQSGLESRFELHGWVDQKSLHERVLPRADVLLLFSPSEGNPLVLGEALAHGVVPVTTPFLGLRSLSWFQEGQNALTFPFGDVATLASMLQQLAMNPDRLARMSQACREASRNLSWQICEQQWIDTLGDLAGKPPMIPTSDFPFSRPTRAGRLDDLGFHAGTVEKIRRVFRRFPDFHDGWGEWPGTLGLTTSEEAESILRELHAIEIP